MREDTVRPSLSRDEALANAPKGGRDGEFFRVQQVLEELP
jgi:Asp-tRNA(Asn)/Glu-tRNA(Gln) amidotransferase C subunit